MEPEDPKLFEFLKTVLHDMRMRHAETNALNLSSPDRIRAKPYSKFKRQLYVMYRALDPMHKSGLETLFTFLTLNSANAFSLFSAHCSSVWEDCAEDRDVFLHLMYTCGFGYSLLAFCESRGQHGFLSLLPRWIMKVYSEYIAPKFKAVDEWWGLDKFCSSRNLHLILDFINLCYNKQGKLFTYITLENSYYFYGLHNDDTLVLLKKHFPEFKNSVLAEFKSELDDNMVYKGAVMLALIKIELAFDHTANFYNPPSPARRLLYPSIDFFKCHICDTLRYEKPERIKKLLVKQGRIRAKQERDHARARDEQEKVRGEQGNTRDEQEKVHDEQGEVRDEQGKVRYKRKKARGKLEKALNKQEETEVEQEKGYLFQIRYQAIQQRAQDMIERAHFTQEQRQVHSTPEKTSISVEPASATLDEAIAGVQESIDTLTLGESIEKQAPHVTENIHDEEQASATAEQASATSEQASATAEQASATAEQASATAEQASANAEQASAAAEQASAATEQASAAAEKDSAAAEQDSAAAEQDSAAAEKDSAAAEKDSAAAEQDSAAAENEHSLGAAIRVPKIRTGTPLFRVILVNEPPDDMERSSEEIKDVEKPPEEIKRNYCYDCYYCLEDE